MKHFFSKWDDGASAQGKKWEKFQCANGRGEGFFFPLSLSLTFCASKVYQVGIVSTWSVAHTQMRGATAKEKLFESLSKSPSRPMVENQCHEKVGSASFLPSFMQLSKKEGEEGPGRRRREGGEYDN